LKTKTVIVKLEESASNFLSDSVKLRVPQRRSRSAIVRHLISVAQANPILLGPLGSVVFSPNIQAE